MNLNKTVFCSEYIHYTINKAILTLMFTLILDKWQSLSFKFSMHNIQIECPNFLNQVLEYSNYYYHGNFYSIRAMWTTIAFLEQD